MHMSTVTRRITHILVPFPRMTWILVFLLFAITKCENIRTETVLPVETTMIIPSTKIGTTENSTSDRFFNAPTEFLIGYYLDWKVVKGHCSSPDVANGTFVDIGGVNVTGNHTYVHGTVATYKCINLHDRLINATDSKEQHLLRVCDSSTKKWTGPTPICEITCQPVVLNDDMAFLYKVTYDILPLSGGRLVIGTKAWVKCNFTIAFEDSINHTNIVCQPNGTWTGILSTCSFFKERATVRLTLFATGVIVVCALGLLIFIVGCFVIYQRVNKKNPIIRKNASNAAQRTTVPYGGFYSFQETPTNDGDRAEYATIRRLGTSGHPRNKPFAPMSVTYNKIN